MRKIVFWNLLLVLTFGLNVYSEPISSSDPAQKEEDTQAIFNQAHDLYQKAQYAEALPLFEKVLSSEPSNVKAQVYYGVCWMGKEDFTRAIQELEKGLKMDEKFALTHYSLAISFARKNPPDVSKSEAHLKLAKTHGYQVPVWFENYLAGLKRGPTNNLPSDQKVTSQDSKNTNP